MQIVVENLFDGPNNVRLFRNERLVDAIAYGIDQQVNFDGKELEPTPMQVYRMAPITDQQATIKAFEAVKEWVRQNATNDLKG